MREPPRGLDDAVASFAGFIRDLPEDLLRPATGPEWGPREVLAHLATWHETYAAIVRALLHGEAPVLRAGTFKRLNADAVELNRTVPVDELLSRLRRAQEELRAFGATGEAHRLSFSFREGSRVWPFDRAMELIEGHIRLHHRRLAKALQRTRGRRGTLAGRLAPT